MPNWPAIDLSAPVLFYGAGSSSGQFFVQALRIAGFTDIFAVASGHHHEFLRSLGATQCFDYHSPDVESQIRSSLASTKHGHLSAALDPIATRRSLSLLSEVLASPATLPRAHLAVLHPFKDGDAVTNEPDSAMHLTSPPWLEEVFSGKNVEVIPIATFRIGEDSFSHENILSMILPRLLEKGEIHANPVRLIKEGSLLERVNTRLDLFRNNKVSGKKVVVDMRV